MKVQQKQVHDKIDCQASTSLVSEPEMALDLGLFMFEDDFSQQLSVQHQEEFDYFGNESHNSHLPEPDHDIDSRGLDQQSQRLLPAQTPSSPILDLSDSPDTQTVQCTQTPLGSDMSISPQNPAGTPSLKEAPKQLSQGLVKEEGQLDRVAAESQVLRIDHDNWLIEPKIKRSRNITKAIRKYLERYLSKYKNHFASHPEFYKKFRQELRQSKESYFSLENMNKIFLQEQVSEELKSLPRLIIRKILNRALRKEIIPNNQVKEKLTYLVSTKVYSLRCSNELLSTRVQMR